MYSNINWLEAIGSSPIFIVLIGLSVVTLAAAMERLHYFWKRNGQADEALDRAAREIRRGDRKEAKRICDSCRHPFGAVAGSIIENEGLDSEKTEEQLQVSLSQQRLLLENNLGILGTMAAIAPLVGLLGTVWGVMDAFAGMAASGNAALSAVAPGISGALLTTIVGLLVALPSMIGYNLLSSKIRSLSVQMDNFAQEYISAIQNSYVIEA